MRSHVFIYKPNYILNILFGVLPLQQFGNGCQLDVAGALVNGTNLAVSPVLLGKALSDEAHAAHPFHSLSADAPGDLRCKELGHRSISDKVFARFLFAGGVVNECAGGADFGVCLSYLMLHALEFTNELAKLLAVVPAVSGYHVSLVPRSLGLKYGRLTLQHFPRRPTRDLSSVRQYRYVLRSTGQWHTCIPCPLRRGGFPSGSPRRRS
jgi:hypothetical protein